ncbi:MAG: hypothetical protein EPO12_17830 [Aquabacterium sp.]|nr:MAG: hypothetical protein EPO12_17830 [Aquabacterium sp.]
MGIARPRLSEWKAGKHHPAASTLAYLANRAGLPVLQTVAEIEAQLDERNGGIWRDALKKLRSAGVTASVLLVIGISGAPTNSHANQRVNSHADNATAIHIVMY